MPVSICVLIGTVQHTVQLGNTASKLRLNLVNSSVTYDASPEAGKADVPESCLRACRRCTVNATTDKVRLQLGDHQVCIRHSILRLVDPQPVQN